MSCRCSIAIAGNMRGSNGGSFNDVPVSDTDPGNRRRQKKSKNDNVKEQHGVKTDALETSCL